MSNIDLIDAANALSLKNFRGVFMRDQLPKKTNNVETGIINLDYKTPPKEFMRYINEKSIPIFYSTLPTQQLNDPPICGREVLNVLTKISKFPSKPPHLVVNEYTSGKLIN